MSKRRSRTNKPPNLLRSDGALCLTFVNTGSDRRQNLDRFTELLTWSQLYDDLEPDDAKRLPARADAEPEAVEIALAAAKRLRDVLARIFNALADLEQPAAEDMEAFNSRFLAKLPPRYVAPADAGFS